MKRLQKNIKKERLVTDFSIFTNKVVLYRYMKLPIAIVLYLFVFVSGFAQSLVSYTNSRNGQTYRINDPIQIGKGSNPDGTFKFIYWQSALLSKMDVSSLTPGYSGTITAFRSFRATNNKSGLFYTSILKLAGNTGYNCVVELDNAIRFGELVPVGASLAQKEEAIPPMPEKVVVKPVPSRVSEAIALANKKLDEELQKSQKELDSLRSSKKLQESQLKEKEAEIRRRQGEAELRSAEIRKLAEDTSMRGLQLLENVKAIEQMKLQNQLIQNQLELEKKEIDIRESELENERLIRSGLIAGIVMFLLVLLLLLNLYWVNKKSNRELSKRNYEILSQKEEIEKKQYEITTKNRQITDSISYAKRIQEASLPAIPQLSKQFSSNLLYFRPRDIVSGDFYWFYENADSRFMAVVDCTGHGVPGAFMSLIGVNLLAETVEVHKIFSPAQILTRMNERIIQVLRQTGERKDPRDGMDMIILVIHKKENKVVFSGANRPLLHIREGVMEIYKGNKFSIGGYYQEEKKFVEQELAFKKGDSFIMFTDGLSDQMGGAHKRKLSTRKLTEWILEVMNEPEINQYDALDEKMRDWQGNNRQLDDMLLWAIKV